MNTPRWFTRRVFVWGVGLLLIGLIGVSLTVRGDRQPMPCEEWDTRRFHHRASPEMVQQCLDAGHVEINQVDGDGRTLLHRIAADFKYTQTFGGYRSPEGVDLYGSAPRGETADPRIPGNTQEQRLAIVRVLLQSPALALDLLDNKDRTAFHYAIRTGDAYPLAQLLIQAGAAITPSEHAREQWEQRTLPLARTLSQKFKNPFDGSIKLDELLRCDTVECLQEALTKAP